MSTSLSSGCIGTLVESNRSKNIDVTSQESGTSTSATTTGEPPAELPPGVDDSGVADLHALVSSHRDRLASESFTLVSSNQRVEYKKGVLEERGARQVAVKASPGARKFYGQYKHENPKSEYPFQPQFDSDTDLWANQNTVTYRTPDGEIRTEEKSKSGNWMEWFSKRSTLGAVLSKASLVGQSQTDESRRFWLHRTFDLQSIDTSGDYVSSKATAVVKPDGLFERARVVYRWDTRDRRRILTREFQFRDVGETTVQRPDWVLEA